MNYSNSSSASLEVQTGYEATRAEQNIQSRCSNEAENLEVIDLLFEDVRPPKFQANRPHLGKDHAAGN